MPDVYILIELADFYDVDIRELIDGESLNAISNFAEGAAIGMVLCGIVFTSRYEQKIRAFKQRLLKRL